MRRDIVERDGPAHPTRSRHHRFSFLSDIVSAYYIMRRLSMFLGNGAGPT